MTCPTCSGPIEQEPICPGYTDPGSGMWVQCYPACGNGTLYECANVMCGWWFIENMNPRNTLFGKNESNRPPWARSQRSART